MYRLVSLVFVTCHHCLFVRGYFEPRFVTVTPFRFSRRRHRLLCQTTFCATLLQRRGRSRQFISVFPRHRLVRLHLL